MTNGLPSHGTPARFSVAARLRSFAFAARGLCCLIRDERNARVHLAVSLLVVVAGVALDISVADWRWLVVSMAVVWLAEAFNTAIEELCDRMTSEFDPAIGRIKDIAAGSVLVAASMAAVIGVLTLAPSLLHRLT